MRFLFLLCLCRILEIVCSDVANNSEFSNRKNRVRDIRYNLKEKDDKVIQMIEQQMLSLNKSSDASRDKRALGILLQGFMEALGYTVSPLQVASFANPPAPGQMPTVTAQLGPIPTPAFLANGTAPAAVTPAPAAAAPGPTPPPRQRETLRFTGVLNFGNNANTSNLVNHLAQYEQLFHSDGSARPSSPPPPPAPMPSIDPRARPPLPEPLFVKIPLPIVPNLPPPQPPSPMPLNNDYQKEFMKEDLEEYEGSDDDEGQQGEYEEENDKTHRSEEYENKQEHYDEPEEKNYEYSGYEKPEEKNTEKEYKNNQNIVNYSVENKEIYDPSEVSEEVPMTNTKFNHAVYINEPDWKKNHEQRVYNLAAEQEAHAEAVAEQNAQREKERNREHELNEENREYHNSREKEVNDRDEKEGARYEANSNKKPYYKDDEEDEDNSDSSEKESYADNRRENNDSEEDYQQESKVSEVPPKNSYYTTPANDISVENTAPTEKPTIKTYYAYSSENSEPTAKYNKNYDYVDKRGKSQNGEPNIYYSTLPVNYDGGSSQRDYVLRDSYGENLEKPNGKVDERLSSYFTMFKNPQTGIYDPNRIRQYENTHLPYDHLDLVNGFKRIQKEYGQPQNRYEEYEINDEIDEQVEHREKNNLRKPPTKDYEHERSENESRKNFKKVHPELTDCDCNTKKGDGQYEEARNHGKSATTGLLPTRISEIPPNYGSYHPTVKYLYEPLDYDQSIIASLTSYTPPTTTRLEDAAKYITKSGHTIANLQQPTIRATETALPDKLTTKSLLPDSEIKEIRAWPAPFDYTYDNSQRSNVVLKKTPYDTINQQPTTHRSSYDGTKSNCNNEPPSTPPEQFVTKVQELLRDHENERYEIDNRNRRQRRPTNSPRRPTARSSEQQPIRNGHYSSHPTTSTTTNSEKAKKKQSFTTDKSLNYQERNRTPTYPPLPLETHTPHPERTYPTTGLPSQENQKVLRLVEDARNPKDRQPMRAKSTAKKKLSSYLPIDGKNSNEESSNYVEKDGILIIPEPTPYYYNEKFEDFADEPKSDTEKVKVKQYRNRISSVKISNLKQLHPTGNTQILKYTRTL